MDKKKISEKINFIREGIKHYLEESVLHGVMDLEKAKEIAKSANKIIREEIERQNVLEKAVADFSKDNPELAQIMINILAKYHWHAKQSAVEEHVIPAVEKGQLFLAEKLLRDILAYHPSRTIYNYTSSEG